VLDAPCAGLIDSINQPRKRLVVVSREEGESAENHASRHLWVRRWRRGCAQVGTPGWLRRVAKDLGFHALIDRHPLKGIALVVATALNGVTVLKLFFRLFGGPDRERGLADLTMRERLGLWGLVAMLIIAGILPSTWVDRASAAAMTTAARMESR
jgi:NADH:ubiquinone oxidoreductase subunit 4 (subunit M)